MARTRQEIENEMYAEKAALEAGPYPELAALDTNSATGVWRGILSAVGFGHWVLEKLWDAFKTSLEALIRQNIYGTLPWYVKVAKEFQWNASVSYPLVLNDALEAVYATPVPEDQIIKFAAATETLVALVPIVTVKVAAADGDGRPAPLGTPALVAFRDEYLNRKKPAGIRTQVVSLPADELLPTIIVQHSPLAVPAELRTRLNDALTAYLNSLPFDGEVAVEAIRDAMQDVDRNLIRDVAVAACLVYTGGGATLNDLVLERRLRLAAGYAVPHPDYEASNTTYLQLVPAL